MRTLATPLIIALAVIIAFFIAASAYKQRFRSAETISVTGLAEKDFVSDQIVWKGSFSRQAFELRSAYASLKEDEVEIKRYLNGAGIPDSSIVFSSIDVQRSYDTRYDENGRMTGNVFNGYILTGRVTVDSRNIAAVEKLSREITGLLEKGIELNSQPPSYYYSRLNELKIDLLANAAVDAKLRAETIAKNSDVGLGNLKKANMGVFQITGKNSNEDYSYGGVFNTSSKEKTASITLRVEYGMD
ncbi:MAG: SIMPL domain-containing protein [Chitinophagaceae bacterium]